MAIGNTLITDSAGVADPPAEYVFICDTANEIKYVIQPAGNHGSVLNIHTTEAQLSNQFYEEKKTVLYSMFDKNPDTDVSGVPLWVDVGDLTLAQWQDIHFLNGETSLDDLEGLNCLLPGDVFRPADSVHTTPTVDGFTPIAGIFLEPSFPRPTTNIADVAPFAEPRVVSASHTIDATRAPTMLGTRSLADTTPSYTNAYEDVNFYVRRIRRFHGVQDTITEKLDALRFLYEIRRGTFDSYDAATRVLTASLVPYGTATNLGAFNDTAVNINPGDTVRLLDSNGDLVDTVEVQQVSSPTTLTLQRPGFTADLTTVSSFEVYLRQAFVPHEQSNEQLLSTLTDEVVYKRSVSYPAGAVTPEDGGFVDMYSTDATPNGLQDPDISPTGTYASWEAAGRSSRRLSDRRSCWPSL